MSSKRGTRHGPKAKINRRFRANVYSLGASAQKATERKPYPPGQHGPTLRRKPSDYALGNNELQKLAYKYGSRKKQIRRIYEHAKSHPGVTGEVMLQTLETSLASVVYLMGFAETRRGARQFVVHGHILVNGQRVDIPSYHCQAGDVIEVSQKTSSRRLATSSTERSTHRAVPAWLNVESADALKGTLVRMPNRDEIGDEVDEQRIIEFYSR